MHEILRTCLLEAPVLSGSQALIKYLQSAMAHLPLEEVRALFLNAGNRLISDEIVAFGGGSEVRLVNRRVVARALEVGANGLDLVHNHPSGDPTPSIADLRAIKSLEAICRRLDIRLDDQVIVGSEGVRSLRRMGKLR